MDLYQEDNYKRIIRQRAKDLGRSKKHLTLQKIAARIEIQNSYLSRALNDEKTHLNEDHLFKICKVLELFPQEIDYVFLLRARAIATDSERRTFIENKINRLRQAAARSAMIQDFDERKIKEEMAYFFDPVCSLVFVALFIPEYLQNPQRLCGLMGLSRQNLKDALRKIRDMDLIALSEDGLKVERVNHQQIHYGTDHPLMRTHQNLLRQKSVARLLQVPEDEKHCFLGTFSADMETFLKIKARFREFFTEVEKLVAPAPSRHVFQINFDLFKWF